MLSNNKPSVAKICHEAYLPGMSTMNISLPESLKSFVDEQVTRRGYATSSEYVRELIGIDQDRQRLRDLLLEGVGPSATTAADDAFFNGLRDQVRSANVK